MNPTLMPWLPDPDVPAPNGDPREPLPQLLPGEPENPQRRPRLLDLFAGAGGASVGYVRAGFEVVGVDIRPMSRYPFEFHQADALTFPLDGFDAIHASPPCQRYSRGTVDKPRHPDLLPPIRARLLAEATVPWVIENVPGAPMRADYRLCGCMFDLPGLRRERWFETSWHGFDFRSPCHHPDPIVTVIGHGPNQHSAYRHIKSPEWERLKRRAMGIDWMTGDELSQAIPPAYATFIGELLLAQIPRAAAHVGARPTTVTRSSAGVPAPRGDDAAARVTSRGGGDDTGDGRRLYAGDGVTPPEASVVRGIASASTSTTQGSNP